MIKVRDSAISLAGVVLGQGIFFACVTLIGREQGPASLGHFNACLAAGTLAGTLAVLRYELACMNESPAKAFEALLHAVALGLAIGAVAAMALLLSGLTHYWTIEVFAFSLLVQNVGALYLNSLRRYALIFVCRLVANLAFLIWLCCAHWLGLVYDAFCSYAVIYLGVALGTLLCFWGHGRRKGYTLGLRREFYGEHARYPKYILPSTVLGSVLSYALSILVPVWYNAEQSGYFALAYRLGVFPVSLIGQSIGGVFRRDAIESAQSPKPAVSLQSVFSTYARFLVAIAGMYALTVLFLFEPLVNLVFGAHWSGAATYLRVLTPLFALQIIYVPLSQVFLATKRQRLDFAVQLFTAAALGLALCAIGNWRPEMTSALLLFSCVGALCTLVGICASTWAARFRLRDLLRVGR